MKLVKSGGVCFLRVVLWWILLGKYRFWKKRSEILINRLALMDKK
jgi:hypothetical protein